MSTLGEPVGDNGAEDLESGNRELAVADTTKPEREAESAGWWSQPCGPGEVLAIALPLVVSTTAWTVMNFTDRVFLFWHSRDEMAAAMPAGMLLFTLMCFPLGLVSYVNTFVAQYHGAQRPDRIGRALGQAIWLAGICIPLFLLARPFSGLIFSAFGHEASLADLEGRYFQVMVWGAGASIMASALSAFFTGRGETSVVMFVHVFGSALNIVLDYLWIFGYGGFPEGGIEGAAWATVTSDWVKTAIFAGLVFTPAHRDQYALDAGLGLDASLMRRLLFYGGANGLHMLVETGAFTFFLMLMGVLGTAATAATTMAFTINSMAFVPMLGVGMAVSTLVGREIGAGRPEMAHRAALNAAYLALAYTGAFAAAYLIVPQFFLAAYRAGIDQREFAELETTAIVLMQFIAVYCLLDAVNIVFSSAIRGAGDTNFVLGATFAIGGGCLALGAYGLKYLDFGLYECWAVITFWIALMGIVFTARFWHGGWREMKVIEPDVALLADEAA